jgi:hypothetical protein
MDSISRALGRIEANQDAHGERAKRIEARIEKMEIYLDEIRRRTFIQKGAIMILSVMASGLVTAIGFAIEYYARS